MKKESSLKLVLAVLVIILLVLVSFGGIYQKKGNVMKNMLPEYSYSMDFGTNTLVRLEADREEEKTSEQASNEDSNSNSENENDNNQNGESTENSENTEQKQENVYTLDNYKKTKSIIENRLALAGVEQYTVRLNEGNGDIIIEIPEDVDTRSIQNLFVVGKLEIKIKETGEVIGDGGSINKIENSIDDSYSTYLGSSVRMEILFKDEAKNKFKELKDNYVVPTDEEGKQTENNVEIMIDGSTICTLTETEFLEAGVEGKLPLNLGGYTQENNELQNNLKEANSIRNIVQNGYLPVKYNVKYSNDVHSDVDKNVIVIAGAVVFAIMLVYCLIKFKARGILAELNILGLGATLLFALRYTKVQISISSVLSIGIVLVLQLVYLTKLLKSGKPDTKEFNDTTFKFTKVIFPAFIAGIVSSLLPVIISNLNVPGNTLELISAGMVLFWGFITFEVYNYIITKAVFTDAKNK